MARSIRLCSRLTQQPPSLNCPDQIAMRRPDTEQTGICPPLAATSSAKSSSIRTGGGPWMLRQNRGIGKRPPECQVPCNVKTQSDGDRLAQTVVCRDEPSRDRGRRRTIDSDLSERQV